MLSFAKDGFVITIGEFGIIFALHKKNKIENKIFFKELNEETSKNLTQILNQNKNLPVYILLDTVDQSYKKKDYPFIKKNDLTHLIKRDFEEDSDKNSLKNHIILNLNEKDKAQKDKKWHCLFISASISNITQKIIDFINKNENRLIGVYLCPLESISLFKTLKESIKSSSKIGEKKSETYCLVTQSKISKTRQTVFFQDQLIFTRLLDYDCLDANFIEKYEKDLMATLQYLRKIFPEIDVSEIETVNILPNNTLKGIEKIKNIELNFVNYTPYKAALIAFKNFEISENSEVCDLIFSKIFFDNKKKISRFSNKKIDYVEKMFLAMKFSYFFNLFMLVLIGFYCLFSISKINESQENIAYSKALELSALQGLNQATKKILGGEEIIDQNSNEKIDIDKIIDFGKINEQLQNVENIIYEKYSNLRFIKNHPVKFEKVIIEVKGFDKEKISRLNYTIELKGKIYNKNGDIENLFSEFDGISSEFKKNFSKEKLTLSELPRNIDFAQKYYEFNINFSIDGKL